MEKQLREILDDGTNDSCLPSKADVLAQFDAFIVDAQRYRGLRLIICEPDEALRQTMIDAIERTLPSLISDDEIAPSPALIDELFDKLILVAAEARNADS